MLYQLCLLVVFLLGTLAAPIEERALEKRGGKFKGDLTFYTPGLGSCGETNGDKDLIAALNAPQMGSHGNPNNNPMCGKKAKVTGPKGSVTVTIVDTCPPCKYGDLDLSPKAFSMVGNFDDGRIKGTWTWV